VHEARPDYGSPADSAAYLLATRIESAVRTGRTDEINRIVKGADPAALGEVVRHATDLPPGDLGRQTFALLAAAGSQGARDEALLKLSDRLSDYGLIANPHSMSSVIHNDNVKANPEKFSALRREDSRDIAALLDAGANPLVYQQLISVDTQATITQSAASQMKPYLTEINGFRHGQSAGTRSHSVDAADATLTPAPQHDDAPVKLTKDEIIEAQTMLNAQGYHVGNADGVIGKQTRGGEVAGFEGIRGFEKDHGLKVDGNFDREMLNALRQAQDAASQYHAAGGSAASQTDAGHKSPANAAGTAPAERANAR
jgi:hypothetical protein